MPRGSPHPRALFSLLPGNERTSALLECPENAHLVSILDRNRSEAAVIDIGPHIGSKSRYTLATIDRCGDIYVDGSGVSRVQCSFEVHEDTAEVMLQDRSSNKSTQLLGETAVPFENNRPYRRVVIDSETNLEFGFGGSKCDLYVFKIIWHSDNDAIDAIDDLDDREDNPRYTRTVLDEALTAAPSGPVTRIHTPGMTEKVRHSRRVRLGSGAFGEAWKVVNVDTGGFLAVKLVKRPLLNSYQFLALKREVEVLSHVSHRNIIEYKAVQWTDDQEYLEIYMDVKPGNIETLIEDEFFTQNPAYTNHLLFQMLQALDYLANENIIHRDVKPANILYSPASPNSPGGSYVFQLADFGVANLAARAETDAGTTPYKAPELVEAIPPRPQTPKLDVWSLFVTLAMAMDAASIRSKQMYNTSLRIQAVHEAASVDDFRALHRMVAVDPGQRASAGDMLDMLFFGDGRVSPREVRPPAGAEQAAPGPSAEVVNQGNTSKGKAPFRDHADKADWRGANPPARNHVMMLAEHETVKAGPAASKNAPGLVEGSSTQGLWLNPSVHAYASPAASSMGMHATQVNRPLFNR